MVKYILAKRKKIKQGKSTSTCTTTINILHCLKNNDIFFYFFFRPVKAWFA